MVMINALNFVFGLHPAGIHLHVESRNWFLIMAMLERERGVNYNEAYIMAMLERERVVNYNEAYRDRRYVTMQGQRTSMTVNVEKMSSFSPPLSAFQKVIDEADSVFINFIYVSANRQLTEEADVLNSIITSILGIRNFTPNATRYVDYRDGKILHYIYRFDIYLQIVYICNLFH